MASLFVDIMSMGTWVNRALLSSGYQVDDKEKRMAEIDRFFDEQNCPGGLLSENTGQILFAIGALIGKIAIKEFGGDWETDDNDPEGELKCAVCLPNGVRFYPMARCVRRLQNGQADSIRDYYVMIGEMAQRHPSE